MPNPYPDIPEVAEDAEISARAANRLIRQVNRNRVIPGDGIHADFTDGGSILSVDFPTGLVGALTPSGGIPCATGAPPAPGSATCALFDLIGSGAWTPRGVSVTVFNDFTNSSSTGIGGGKYIICFVATDGTVRALGEPC